MGWPGKWAAAWSAAKDEFKAVTDEKKPDAKSFIGLISKHKSGVHTSLKEVDSAYEEYLQGIRDFANDKLKLSKLHDLHNAFGRKVEAAKGEAAKYGEVLSKAIDKEQDKNQKSLRYRALKSMQKHLDAIIEDINTMQMKLFAQRNMEVESKERAMTSQEKVAMSSDPVIMKGVISTSAAAKAFIAKCKVLVDKSNGNLAPAVQYYNDNIQKICRDITQNLTNAEKRLGAAFDSQTKQAEQLLIVRNGGSFKLAATIQVNDYVNELKDLVRAVKTVEQWAKAQG